MSIGAEDGGPTTSAVSTPLGSFYARIGITLLLGLFPLFVSFIVQVFLYSNFEPREVLFGSGGGQLLLVSNGFLTAAAVVALHVTSEEYQVRRQVFLMLFVVTALVNAQLYALTADRSRPVTGTADALSVASLLISVGLLGVSLFQQFRDQQLSLRRAEKDRLEKIRSSVGEALRDTFQIEGDVDFSGYCLLTFDGKEVLPDDDIVVNAVDFSGTLGVQVGASRSSLSHVKSAERLHVGGSQRLDSVAVRVVPEGTAVRFGQEDATLRLDDEKAIKTCSFDFVVEKDRAANDNERDVVVTILVEGIYTRSLRRRLLVSAGDGQPLES